MPTVSLEDKDYEINSDQPVYMELSDQGMDLPHGCLSGACSACKVEILSGAENLSPPDVIEANTLEAVKSEFPDKTIRLSCRAKLLSGKISIQSI